MPTQADRKSIEDYGLQILDPLLNDDEFLGKRWVATTLTFFTTKAAYDQLRSQWTVSGFANVATCFAVFLTGETLSVRLDWVRQHQLNNAPFMATIS